MEQITVAGGTLLDNNNNNNAAVTTAVDPLETPHPTTGGKPQIQLSMNQEVELSKLVLKSTTPQHGDGSSCPVHGQSHNHSHSHGHTCEHHHHHHGEQPRVQQGTWQIQTPDGKTQPMPVPVQAMSLMVPLEQVMKGTREEIMNSVSTLLRLGPYDKWSACVKLVTEKEKDEQSKGQLKSDPDDHATNNKNNDNDWKNKTWWNWIDGNGHTLLHWAAKRGDDKRFVQYFIEHCPPGILKQLVHQTSHDSTGMTPIHWACTEPGAQSLGILALFLDGIPHFPVNLEVTDASGCTPLLIAAQYGQVEVCAYLLQKGRADLYAVDSSMDSALHWAAYKGSLPVCGLLLWYHDHYQNNTDLNGSNSSRSRRNRHHHHHRHNDDLSELMAPDQYEQTPLHLAALRGHTSVVRYLLQRTAPTAHQQQELLFQKDHNGRTPLDLAIHKGRPTVQAVLQKAHDQFQANRNRGASAITKWCQSNAWKFTRETFSVNAWMLWLGMAPQGGPMDEMDEAPKFPYYYLWIHGILHFFGWYPFIFCPFHSPATGVLWDMPFWHLFNFFDMVSCMFFLYKTTTTSPGLLDGSDNDERNKKALQKYRKLYETTLESYATTDDMQKAIQEQVRTFV